MGLTNAERQRRHRERVKQKLAAASGSDSEDTLKARIAELEAEKALLATKLSLAQQAIEKASDLSRAEEMLLGEYYGVAETWLQYLGTDENHPAHRYRIEAHNAFVTEDIGFADILMMVHHEAFSRLNDYFSKACASYEYDVQEPKWRSHAKSLAERVT